MRAISAEAVDLDLVFSVPAVVIADYRNETRLFACRCFIFGQQKSGGAVTHHGENRHIRTGQAGGNGIGGAGPDCAGDAVDDARAVMDDALRPLPAFATVTDQYRTGRFGQPRGDGGADGSGVQSVIATGPID